MLFALLQAPQPPIIPDPSDLIAQLKDAWTHQHWLVFTALIVGTVVAVSKQGWFGPILARIPKPLLPYFGIAIGVLTTMSTDLYQGKTIAQTIVDCLGGILAACMAVMGHQTVIEHMRGGKELIPKAPWGGTPPGAMNPVEREAAKIGPPPNPPALGYRLRRIATACMLAMAVCALTVTTGCSSILSNPVYVAEQLSQYVTLFIQTAQTIWQTILPLLGSNAAAANAAFTDAIVVLQQANAAMMDAAQAVAAGKVEDLASLIADVQKAVEAVMTVIAQFEQQAPGAIAATGSKMDTLTHMAMSIKHWGPTP